MNDIETTDVTSEDIYFGLGITCYGKTNADECFWGYNIYLFKKEITFNEVIRCDFVKIHEETEVLDNSEMGYDDNDAYMLSIMKALSYVNESDFSDMVKYVHFNNASFDIDNNIPLKAMKVINNEEYFMDMLNKFSLSDIEDFTKKIDKHYIEFIHDRTNSMNYGFAKDLKEKCCVEKAVVVVESNIDFMNKVNSGSIPLHRTLSKAEKKKISRQKLGKIPPNVCVKERKSIIIHTDGSIHRYGKKSGYGCVFINEKEEKIFSLIGSIPFVKKRLNIQYVEMYAIYRSLFILKEKIKAGDLEKIDNVIIYSDSQNSIDCLQGSFVWKDHNDAVLMKKLYSDILELSSDFKVYYEGVEGHSGDIYNEYADSLARQGAMKGFTGEMINYYRS